MSERAPYSRVYWTIRNDERLASIYPDDRHLATWLRLLLAADMSWPAPADLPASSRKASIAALEAAGVIELLPGGLFCFHGLDAERGRRRDAAASGAGHRWGTGRSPDGYQTDPGRNASRAEPRQAEPSRDTPAREKVGLDTSEGRVFAFIARYGAAIREDSPLGRRLLGLIERRGVEEVLRNAGALAKSNGAMSDRQWVLGLENIIEAVPSAKNGHEIDRAEEDAKRAERRQTEVDARRLEWFRNTGKWDPAWGPTPEAAA